MKLVDQLGTHDPVAIVPSTSSAPNQVLCNPVDKTLLTPGPGGVPGTSYPASNVNAHLYCYQDNTFQPTTDPGGYTVNNQFGTYTLTVTTPTSLCLPSYKYDPTTQAAGSVNPSNWADPSTLQLNHFQCYDVSITSAPTPPVVQLQDQFGTYTSVQVGAATQLCAPVIKTVENATGQPVGPDSDINSDGVNGAHLLCFAIDTQVVSHTPNVFIGNQFTTTPPAGWARDTCPGPGGGPGTAKLAVPAVIQDSHRGYRDARSALCHLASPRRRDPRRRKRMDGKPTEAAVHGSLIGFDSRSTIRPGTTLVAPSLQCHESVTAEHHCSVVTDFGLRRGPP